VEDALADVMHRTLFGLRPDVNVHGRPGRRPPARLPVGPVMAESLARNTAPPLAGPTLDALMDAGRRVFVSHGYHGTRVDDIVAAADLSHGAFYRYFRNKDQLAQLLAAQALQHVSTALVEMPDPADDTSPAALRQWLRRYNQAQADEAAMIRVWVDAALQDPALLADSAYVLDWGRRRMARFLRPRRFGDPETDAVALLALVDAVGTHHRPPTTIDAAVRVIERGFLGR
jgi:AcrR family transcriptional regulator